jgi:hypothetical protein
MNSFTAESQGSFPNEVHYHVISPGLRDECYRPQADANDTPRGIFYSLLSEIDSGYVARRKCQTSSLNYSSAEVNLTAT